MSGYPSAGCGLLGLLSTAATASVPGTTGTPAAGEPLCGGLVTEQLEVRRRRADEDEPGVLTCPRERGAFREESVAGMNRVDARLLRRLHDGVDVEVRADRLASAARADEVRLVGLEPMQGEAVFVAVDRHSAQARARWRRGSTGWRSRTGWRQGASGCAWWVGTESAPERPGAGVCRIAVAPVNAA